MSEIKVEEVESQFDSRQPQVSKLAHKTQGIQSQENQKTVSNLHASHPIAEKHVDAAIHKNEVTNIKDTKENNDFKQIHEDKSANEIPSIPPSFQIIEVAKWTIQRNGQHLERIEKTEIKKAKNVQTRKAYVDHRESYQSALKKLSFHKKDHLTTSLLKNHQVRLPPPSDKNEKKGKLSIFEKVPGLIDFGLSVEDQEEESEIIIETLLDQTSLHRSQQSSRRLEPISRLQEDISKKDELRRSESRLKQLNKYLEKCKTFDPLFGYNPSIKQSKSQQKLTLNPSQVATLPIACPLKRSVVQLLILTKDTDSR